MILFASTGSWGEVSPLLSLAQHFKGRMACGPEWVMRANQYAPSMSIGLPIQHDFTAKGFLLALNFERLFLDLWKASEGCDAIVSAFFLWPAVFVARLRKIPYIATTISSIYLQEDNVPVETMSAIYSKLDELRDMVNLQQEDLSRPPHLLLLYPGFLGGIGYPSLSDPNEAVPEGDYCAVSSGTVNPDWREEAEAACQQMGLRCEYLDSTSFKFNHRKLMQNAKAAMVHGGVGTLVDCVAAKTPIIVRPFAYDQHHNAEKLVSLGATAWPELTPGIVQAEVEPVELVYERVADAFSRHF